MMRNASAVEAQLIYAITLPISGAIVLLTLLLMVGIFCSRRLHSPQTRFFLSLLLADLCTGAALPFIPWMGLARPLSFSSCVLVHVLPNFLLLAFLCNLVLVHYERYRSIVRPLRRGTRRVALPLLLVWALPLVFALLPAFGWNNRALQERSNGTARSPCPSDSHCCTYRSVFPNAFIYLEVYGVLAPAICSIAVMTCRVLWVARGQLRGIQRLQVRASRAHRRRMELRYACCVASVSLAFLACWLPYIVCTHVGVEFLLRHRESSGRGGHVVLSCVGIAGIAVVPLLLGLANREYTDPVRKLLRRCCHTRPRGTRTRRSATAHDTDSLQAGCTMFRLI